MAKRRQDEPPENDRQKLVRVEPPGEDPLPMLPRDFAEIEIQAKRLDILQIPAFVRVNRISSHALNVYYWKMDEDFGSPFIKPKEDNTNHHRSAYAFIDELKRFGDGIFTGPEFYSMASLAMAVGSQAVSRRLHSPDLFAALQSGLQNTIANAYADYRVARAQTHPPGDPAQLRPTALDDWHAFAVAPGGLRLPNFIFTRRSHVRDDVSWGRQVGRYLFFALPNTHVEMLKENAAVQVTLNINMLLPHTPFPAVIERSLHATFLLSLEDERSTAIFTNDANRPVMEVDFYASINDFPIIYVENDGSETSYVEVACHAFVRRIDWDALAPPASWMQRVFRAVDRQQDNWILDRSIMVHAHGDPVPHRKGSQTIIPKRLFYRLLTFMFPGVNFAEAASAQECQVLLKQLHNEQLPIFETAMPPT